MVLRAPEHYDFFVWSSGVSTLPYFFEMIPRSKLLDLAGYDETVSRPRNFSCNSSTLCSILLDRENFLTIAMAILVATKPITDTNNRRITPPDSFSCVLIIALLHPSTHTFAHRQERLQGKSDCAETRLERCIGIIFVQAIDPVREVNLS